MKWIIFSILLLTIFCLYLPILLITWKWDKNENGLSELCDSLEKLCCLD
jgi:hypothetical protein